MEIYKNLSFEKYKEINAVNNSSLQALRKGFNHYLHGLNNSFDNDAFQFGRACHKYVLELETFFDEYVIGPKVDKRTKKGKEEYQKFLDESGNKEVITQNDFNTISNMRAALMSNKIVKNLITKSQKEVVAVGELEGLTCKARADLLYDNSILIDLKTTVDASKDNFVISMHKYGYFRQASFYADLFGVQSFIFIAIEKARPHDFNIYELQKEDLELGRIEYKAMLQKIKRTNIKKVDHSNKKINFINPPTWIFNRIDSLVEELGE